MRGVLFDVGYTLMDESDRLERALRWLSAPLGKTAAELHERYVAACARPRNQVPSLIVQMLADMGVPHDEADALRKALPWDVVPLTPYADAVDAVRALKDASIRIGVLANQPASARDDLERTGLAALFDDIWLSDAVGLAKPDPAFFQLALDAWGFEPSTVAYVGDRPDNDTKPAKALGLYTVRVLLGPHEQQAPKEDSERADASVATLNAAAVHLLARK
jgi:FMN phosphatase YigB (HAD superfamily)